ncbi:hypothetical protein [Gryllotalpicola koreensis]|uniref:Uncharacterized protein n=1 Tax=Gryllotalpicola koreensis TaxID=993086 RepID=A0ABP8AD17_9MICO
MGPEERLEALRDDARWQPVRLYPEHGRMPVPARAQPWRVLVGAAVVIAAVAVVFGGISAFRGFGNAAGPLKIDAGAPVVTSAPPATASIPSSGLLAKAKLPSGAIAGTQASPGLPFDNDGSVCGTVSTDARFWTVADLSVDDALSWLTQNPPSGMPVRAGIWQVGSDTVTNGGYVLDAAGENAGQALLFTVATIQNFGVAIRVDALDLRQGTRCLVNNLNERDPGPQPTAAAAAELQAKLKAASEAAAAAEQAQQQGAASH